MDADPFAEGNIIYSGVSKIAHEFLSPGSFPWQSYPRTVYLLRDLRERIYRLRTMKWVIIVCSDPINRGNFKTEIKP